MFHARIPVAFDQLVVMSVMNDFVPPLKLNGWNG